MCDKSSLSVAVASFQTSASAFRLPTLGSRRKRLWEISRDAYCPIIGVCLSLNALRKLVHKINPQLAMLEDYDLHVNVIAQCGSRNRLSEALQHEFEQRFTLVIKRFREAKDKNRLQQLWKAALQQGEVAPAFWACISHPVCDVAMEEHTLLMRELGRVQERSSKMLHEKSQEIAALQSENAQLRSMNIRKESELLYVRNDFSELKASLPEYAERKQLHERVLQLKQRNVELEQRMTELKDELKEQLNVQQNEQKHENKISSPFSNAAFTVADTKLKRTIPIIVHLQEKNVLCVGGRSGSIASYRQLIEKVGGHFAHHDGGIEDTHNQLATSLAAADLVICQTGCISHNAYWRVKEFCKRTGKQCVYIENPSISSFARSLESIASEIKTDKSIID